MAAHAYSLRSRYNSPVSVKPSANTILSKTPITSPRKAPQPVSLKLDHVIGTTTNNPSGLSCCVVSNSYAYCSGSVAVLAEITSDGVVTQRYYKARPTATAVNPSSSYYESPSATPTKRRSSIFPKRRDSDVLSSPGREYNEEGGKTWTARERIKTVTCVSLSRDGRLLAVGETGYNPRVLLFSTVLDAPTDLPLSIMTEHSYGIRCLAFSPDSRWLATLGDVNDGFLFLWSVNTRNGTAKLHATNKCTTNVCHMAWCGRTLITVGTRHVKLWSIPEGETSTPSAKSRLRKLVESPSTSALQPLLGRNCLLGNLVDSMFTCVVPIDECHAIVCADLGQLCLVDTSRAPSEILPVEIGCDALRAADFCIQTQELVWAGERGLQHTGVAGLLEQIKPGSECMSDLTSHRGSRKPSRRSGIRESLGLNQIRSLGIIAIGCLNNHIISINANSALTITESSSESVKLEDTILSSHNEAVTGVQELPQNVEIGDFLTWSKSGEIRFWNRDATLRNTVLIDLEESTTECETYNNEMRVFRHLKDDTFAFGDRIGLLKCVKAVDWQSGQVVRAHSAEVNDICFHALTSIVATCSRDRMVQVFQLTDDKLDLVQTSDDHISAVNQLIFSEDGEKLLSCSSDRTIVVREKARREKEGETAFAFLQTRVITVKASPLSMCLLPGQASSLLVSTMDRYVSKIDFTNGTILNSFKVADADTDDSVILSSIHSMIVDSGTRKESLLVGYSPTDKSVRVYDFEKGILFSRESAHTEGISGLAVLDDDTDEEQLSKKRIVSTGQDSTIMIWTVAAIPQLLPTPLTELSQQQAMMLNDEDGTPMKASPASLPPLRKILSKVDVAEFGVASPRSPSRDSSPARLRRKTSRLALTTSAIDEVDESLQSDDQRKSSAEGKTKVERRSPSPLRSSIRPAKARSRTDLNRDWLRRSPSPPPLSAPSTPRNEQKANKARLRRPPSVPVDLRSQALAQQNRRQSVGGPNDFGSMGMASEQACRMLKTYRRKLQTAREDLDLDEVEEELEAVLRVIHRRRGKMDGMSCGDSRSTANANEDTQLAEMLEHTRLDD